MKKFPKIFLLLLTIGFVKNLNAQTPLPNACTAICLDPLTSPIQSRTPQKVKGIGVCAMVPTDTSLWWVFRPAGTTFNFSWTTTGCTCATGGVAGADVVVYKGTGCNALTKIQCKNGVSGSFALTNLSPCYVYWIQVGSTNTCQCNVKLTYNVTDLIRTIQPVKIAGPNVVCKGVPFTLSASSTNTTCMTTNVNAFSWKLAQGSGQLTNLENGTAEVILDKGGKARVTLEPFLSMCTPSFSKTFIDIEVIDLKESVENVRICAEKNSYSVDLKTIIKKANPTFNRDVIPATFIISEPPGTNKTITVPYTVVGSACAQQVKLNVTVPLIKKTTLPSRLIAEGETFTLKGKTFSCADARSLPISFVKEGNGSETCDSSFAISLQCVKVNPVIYPKATLLDCLNKSVVLDASKTGTIPMAMATGKGNTGIRSYLWSNGATTPKITVAQAGTYSVTVTYTYKWLSTTGTLSKTVTKSASALVIGSANNKPATPLPEVESNAPCVGESTLYYQPRITGVTYKWAATNGTIIGTDNSDSIKVKWSNANPKRLCCRLTANCGAGNDTCMTIQTSTIVPNKPTVILNQCIATNMFRFAAASQTDVKHHWVAQNGTLSSSIGDTITVNWSPMGNRSICVKAVADCTVSDETCVTHSSKSAPTDGSIKMGEQGTESVFEMKVMPNPANEYIEILSNRTIDTYFIYDINGRLLLESNTSTIDISQLNRGIYLLKGIDTQKEVKILNFMKI